MICSCGKTEVGGKFHISNTATASVSRSKIVTMAETALLTAIVILMAFTPLGYLRIVSFCADACTMADNYEDRKCEEIKEKFFTILWKIGLVQ